MKLAPTWMPLIAAFTLIQVTNEKQASAQIPSTPYAFPSYVEPAYPLPGPNYVVYSPTYLAWRSAGYYGGNWGPYYYNPPAMSPYISVNMIRPVRVHAYPPVGGIIYRR